MHHDDANNENLEQFFRKKAGEFNIPFREDDWLKLEKRLDIRDLKIAHRRRVAWIVAASFLIISLLGYFTYENHNRLNEISQLLADGSEPDIVQIQPDDTNQAGVDEIIYPEIESQPAEQDNSHAYEILTDDFAEVQTEHAEIIHETNDHSERVWIDRISINNERITPTQHVSILPHIPDRIAVDFFAEQAEMENQTVKQISPYSAISSLPHFPVENDRPHKSAFAASLVLSPDFSTAGSGSGFAGTGYKFGFLGEYRISQNISLISGLVISNVRYTAFGREYNPPDYWNSGIVPDETSAICLILDIPLNLKFDFLKLGRSGFYATAGLSSYIMLNEDYRFRYSDNGYGLDDRIEIRNGTRHWFNNANLSVGYELAIHSNWSLRAEPFLKIPLSGVGWGDVNLYSAGSFVSLNYQL